MALLLLLGFLDAIVVDEGLRACHAVFFSMYTFFMLPSFFFYRLFPAPLFAGPLCV